MEILILSGVLTSFAVILYYIDRKTQKVNISVIKDILNNDELTIKERIQKSKYLCRCTKGLTSYGMFCVLDTIDKNLK